MVNMNNGQHAIIYFSATTPSHFGPDWIWQQVEMAGKQAVRLKVGTIISAFKNLIGENNYALAAWSKYSTSA